MTLVTTGLIRSIRIIRGRNKPISDAKHCIRSSKRLPKRRLHTAFPASTCIRPRKYVHLSPQVRASEVGFI